MAVELPTPIPLGVSHLSEPPSFNHWSQGNGKKRRMDKRDYLRRPFVRDLWLIDHQSNTVLRCRTDDVSDAGLHATAPVGFGLAVGQTYEMRIANTAAPRGTSPHIAKSLGYGIVTRTEMHIGGERSDRVGFAVRFDVPQLVDV